MARPATGQIIPPKGSRKSWALRVPYMGGREFITLGRPEEGWNRKKADEAREEIMAQIKAGVWAPPELAPVHVEAVEEQTFLEFASEWMAGKEPELRPKTITDYKWALEKHLLSHFGDLKLGDITAQRVDAYKAAKLREGKLAPNAINKTLTRLAQILEAAVEYELIPKNPAAGKRRKVKSTRPKRTWVEPEQLIALLEASDRYFRPMVATLAGAGLRIGEACALNWGDVNLSTGTLTVRASKTEAGEGREVDIPIGLQEELATWRARANKTRSTDPVFVGRPREGRQGRTTPRLAHTRLRTAVKAANKKLEAQGIEPIGDVSPHSLRRTYASLRAALRDDPVYIAEQLGHRDARFTFSTYQRAAKRREKLQGRYLVAFDAATEWAQIGTKAPSAQDDDLRALLSQAQETASESQE